VTIYLVRHAKAEERAEGGDAERRLTADGGVRFRTLAAELSGRMAVARILASPYRRARETAEILAAATGAPIEVEAALASGATPAAELLALAREAGPGTALVGHNPELGQAIGLAAGAALDVRPGTVAAVELGGARAHLLWLEAPSKRL
jgi:phosphohistidine phosphatase